MSLDLKCLTCGVPIDLQREKREPNDIFNWSFDLCEQCFDEECERYEDMYLEYGSVNIYDLA